MALEVIEHVRGKTSAALEDLTEYRSQLNYPHIYMTYARFSYLVGYEHTIRSHAGNNRRIYEYDSTMVRLPSSLWSPPFRRKARNYASKMGRFSILLT